MSTAALLRAALPPLTAAEERALVLAARGGCQRSRERLFRSTIPLVLAIARVYSWHPHADDLQSVALHGALLGVDRFDPDRGRLTTCVALWARQAVGRYLVRARSVVQTSATDRRRRTVVADVELDAPVGDGTETGVGNLADEHAVSPEVAAVASSYRRALERGIARAGIDARAAGVLRRRLDLDPLVAIARDSGTCRERVRQIEAVALPHVRAAVEVEDRVCAARARSARLDATTCDRRAREPERS